jgi:hypothetical protein
MVMEGITIKAIKLMLFVLILGMLVASGAGVNAGLKVLNASGIIVLIPINIYAHP